MNSRESENSPRSSVNTDMATQGEVSNSEAEKKVRTCSACQESTSSANELST